MLTKAAVLHKIGAGWRVEDIELADPQPGEVQVRLAASAWATRTTISAPGPPRSPCRPWAATRARTPTLLEKRVQGAIFGGVSLRQGYQDMRDGKNLRGVIRYTDADY